MKRQIILDTETTGLNPKTGDRVIEIGCVEIINRQLTGNNFHAYVNPERDSDPGALAVHGLTTEFLSDKPKFAEIADAFLSYVRGAEVVIHNAPFDVGFLNVEFSRLGWGPFTSHVEQVTDSLRQAKELHPGKRNSLDALCDRYQISNAHRTLHGALLDAELLAEVFLAMSRGQNALSIEIETDVQIQTIDTQVDDLHLVRVSVIDANSMELEAHETMLSALDKEVRGACVWRSLSSSTTSPV